MDEAGDDSSAAPWRSIDELARLVGAYCWIEQRIFEVAGVWAGRAPAGQRRAVSPRTESAARVWCAATSRRHGELARSWADRLPVRAGVDPGALVTAPSSGLRQTMDLLGALETPDAIGALVDSVLPRLRGAYAVHLRTASAVSEGPVMEVLADAHRRLSGEIHDGRTLLPGLWRGQGRATRDAAPPQAEFEQAFDAAGVFPAVWPS